MALNVLCISFIDYFTRAVNTAQDIARAEIAFVLDKTHFYDHYGEKLNERQGKVIARMFQEDRAGFKGGLSAKNYVSITRCSPVTATHDLPQLHYMGALLSHGRGRGKRYEISYLEAGGYEYYLLMNIIMLISNHALWN